jgi:hypothetical protein
MAEILARCKTNRQWPPCTIVEPMLLQLTSSRLEFSADAGEIALARATFDREHCLTLPGFLAPKLLDAFQQSLDPTEFFERSDKGIATELCLRRTKTTVFLDLLCNDARLFRTIETLTGYREIASFQGRVYRFLPGAEHYDSWHNDALQERLVAMSVNLSPQPYSGGILQIREVNSGNIVREVANTGYGDAIIFRIHPELEHRLTGVSGSMDKTAYAGWFRASAAALTRLKTAIGIGQNHGAGRDSEL